MTLENPITRREAVRAAGVAGAAYIAAPSLLSGMLTPAAARAATSAAKLTPELTEGPYWVNTMLRRADIRANTKSARTSPGVRQKGVPLKLTINVRDASNHRKSLNGVAVDIWHANAHGLYSDETSQQAGGGASGGDTGGENFLRGYQITGKDAGIHRSVAPGRVSFQTIWPGWYASRAIHIHVRVRKLSTSGATIAGYTTQIFFSDADNNRVLTGAAPYDARSPQKDVTTDENDTVLQRSDDATNIVSVKGSLKHGFSAAFNIILDHAEVTAKGSLSRPSSGGGPPQAGGS
jgi:protocatechuate 3,4-dioxygenase beta subunit